MRTIFRLCWISLAAGQLILCLPVAGATRYVWQNSPNPGPPYGTWDTAAHIIQDAVDTAQNGDTVFVTNGVYSTGGTVARSSTLPNRVVIAKDVILKSVNGPLVTLIEGARATRFADTNGNGEDAIRCVYLDGVGGLVGFTLTNGHSSITGDVTSGGAYIRSGYRGFTNCIITGCSAAGGGGGVQGGSLYNCTISNNVAFGEAAGGGTFGCRLYNCVVINNTASGKGSTGGVKGGIVYSSTISGNKASGDWTGGGASECTLYNCTISSNSASGWQIGGGVRASTLYCCAVISNIATGTQEGGGVREGVLYNCTISGNVASGPGDVMAAGGASLGTFYNCTISGNTGSGYQTAGGANESTLYNCIIQFNSSKSWLLNCSGGKLYACCTAPMPTNGFGNITADPQFANLEVGDFHLAAGSPCIDAGMDLTVNSVTNDIEGNIRPMDGDGDGRAYFDIGAYERPGLPMLLVQPKSCTNLVGDTVTFNVSATGAPLMYYQWLFNGTVLTNATNTTLTFSAIAANQAGIYSVVVSNSFNSVISSNATLTVLSALRQTNRVTGMITIPVVGPANVYPSTNLVSGLGRILGLTVALNNLSHSAPIDLDILLVGPQGQKVMLMSDAGGIIGVTNVSLTMDDSAIGFLDASGPIVAGTYRPTDYRAGDILSTTAPTGPYGTSLSVFNGTDPNGPWLLYINDAQAPDGGSLDGWALNLRTELASSLVPRIPLQSLVRLPDERFQFDVSSAPGSILEIQIGTNLTTSLWFPIASLTNQTGSATFTDPVTNEIQRFYRLRLVH